MVSPIDTLPPELLIEIFATSAYQEALAPLVLRRVSKWWREIVNLSPHVWQYIFLDDGVRSVECSRVQAELWTQRSVPLPIDIELKVESLDMILPMLSPLLPSVDRWRTFVVKGRREESMALTSLSMTRESLDSLQIAIQDDDVGLPKTTFTPEWPHNFTMNVWLLEIPQSRLLAPLRFTSITITENPLSDIHTPPGAILDFLTACPELETFYFSGWQHNDEPPKTALPVVSLPNLHTLHLKNTCLARSILSFLYVPRLTHLYLAHLNVEFMLLGEYHEDGDSDDDAHDFSQSPWSDRATGMGLRKLIARSRPPIKLLDMDFSDMRTKDFRYVFDRLPLLEDFLIVASDMSDKVIDMLRPYRLPRPDNTKQIRLPRLRRIGLYNCQRLTGDAIVGALTARIEFTDVNPSCSLDEVAIVACDGFSHRNGEALARQLGTRLRLT
ncbi:hypothetical protein BDZ94DRAFT_1304372 [Collybia nuda]|uniref:F-box domain-containing protein n=1 Tax=Collybia nuda TaxID=64659 RepID=A0A9P5YIR7_9AGAR|nr:hypothetical protein BDZ94DRAFT_1304372 [Collybia nuda]